MARTYRKKPVTVEAVQWTGENHAEMCEFIDPEVFEIIPRVGLVIHTLEGDHHASPGDYIIKGVNGEFYPCKPDIFAKTYASAALTPPNEPLPVLVNDEQGREYIDYICPRCKGIISQRRRGQRMETVYQCKYHDNCGQRMDWSNPQPYRRPPEAKDNNVPTNEPLTIEELLKMDGEPVYVVFMPDSSGKRSQSWALVNVDKKYGEVYLVDSIPGASCYYDEIWADLEGIYRRPPEGEA